MSAGSPAALRLYLITDRKQTGASGLAKAVGEALSAGVRAVQLREKDLDARDLLRLALEMRELTKEAGALLFINDRLDVALASRADGIHLGREGFAPEELRPHWPGLIGVSTHSVAEASAAEAGGADFVTFGPVFHTPSKARYGEPVGLGPLKEAAAALTIPVLGLGGIKAANASSVTEAGAYGIGAISAVLAAGDIKKSVTKILKAID